MEFLIAMVGVPLDVIALANEEWGLGKYICISSGVLVTTSGMRHIGMSNMCHEIH